MLRWIKANAALVAALALCVFFAANPVAHAQSNRAKPPDKKTTADPAKPAPPVKIWAPPPYEPRLLRLSEIMGALSFLQDLCASTQGTQWRKSMLALLQSEGKHPKQKARLAGAFNAGFRGYELSHRKCTPSARLVISRYLREGEKIAQDLANRYGSG